jgi:hypothetical protein
VSVRSYGYDPLGLSKSTEDVEKFRAFELIHARWAMLGALGAIVPEGIDAFGGNIPGAVWWQVRGGTDSVCVSLPRGLEAAALHTPAARQLPARPPCLRRGDVHRPRASLVCLPRGRPEN